MEKLILIYVSALNLLKCIILVEVNGKKIHMLICVCMCIYVHTYTYILSTCVYTHTHTHIYIHTTYNIYTWLHTHIENNDFSKILVCIIFAITITKTSLWIFSLCLCSNTNNKVKKSLDKHSKELCSRYLHHIFTCLSLDKWFNSLISLAHLKTWDINSCPSDLTIIISIK